MELNFTNPSVTTYYYPIIIMLIVILALLEFIIYFLKNTVDDLNSSMNNTLRAGVDYSATFIRKKNTLKFRYLTSYILTRAAMWSKAPYLYTLYSKYHGFSMAEIGILYIIDAVSAFIAGPITGSLADKYGRRLFCQGYNLLVIINLLMRMTGNKPMAYCAQILTGVGGGLINTVFETWVVFEANKEFGIRKIEKERFLKKLFRTQTVLDAIMSIVISALCAIIYSFWGLFAPLIVSILFSAIGMIATQLSWAENKPNEHSKETITKNFGEAFQELKKREVLCMGIVESLFQATVNIYLFAWTPILQASTDKGINPGFIFTCFVITMILGTTIYEIFLIYLKTGYYISITIALLILSVLFYSVAYADDFLLRFLLLACINGVTGFYSPLNSIIKSRILVEKHRATLMSIFRIPLNLYVIIVLISLRYMNPFDVKLIQLY